MTREFNWKKVDCGFQAAMPGEITLCVSPDRTAHFGAKPARGTTWRAGVSHWDESTRTISRYGRDEYNVHHKTREDAMRAAERIYREA